MAQVGLLLQSVKCMGLVELEQFLNNVGHVGRSVTGQGVESTKNDPAAGALVPSSPEQRHREVGAQRLLF